MSTSETKPPKQSSGELSSDLRADAPPTVVSERAKAIARRSFLRRSAGIAAPVVMTLQSGPAMAIASITCQDKTNIVVDNQSGFRQATPPPADLTDSRLLNADNNPLLTDNNSVISQQTPDSALGGLRIPANDGIARCGLTDLGNPAASPPTTGDFTETPGGSNDWVYQGNLAQIDADPRNDRGPIALFNINANNEDVFVGCFGDKNIDVNFPDAHPLTCSCWTSLNPNP